MEERISGMTGMRKRGSWWRKRERTITPERAERSCGDMIVGARNKRRMAGPRS